MKDCKIKLIELERMEKMDLQQKEKVKWIADGDEKYSFLPWFNKEKV